MSMIMYLLRVTPAQIEKLRADPSLLVGACYITPHLEFGDKTQDQVLADLAIHTQSAAFEFSGSIDHWAKKLEEPAKRAAELNLDAAFCLQKEWHMLHYFLNGTGDRVDTPAGALFAGEKLGENLGYGPARFVTPEMTSAFADIVTTLSIAEIQARIDIPAMNQERIYAAPFEDDEEEPAELKRAISAYFPRLQDYLAGARARGDGLLIWIS